MLREGGAVPSVLQTCDGAISHSPVGPGSSMLPRTRAELTRTRRSHGRGDPPEHLIRQQLKVSQREFAGLIKCTLSPNDCMDILKGKNLT
jgi:hypothetical protein